MVFDLDLHCLLRPVYLNTKGKYNKQRDCTAKYSFSGEQVILFLQTV